MAGTDKKTITRSRILNYVINNQVTSKVEVSKNLNLSMPTVLSNVNDLMSSWLMELRLKPENMNLLVDARQKA